jgi:hypothetical protein
MLNTPLTYGKQSMDNQIIILLEFSTVLLIIGLILLFKSLNDD